MVRARWMLVAGAAVPALLTASCGDDAGDTARFCTEVRDNLTALTSNPATVDDIEPFLALYRDIGDVAPLAVQPHWEALVRNYETASTVQPNDPESLQAALAQAYATEESAVAVHDFLRTRCNVDLGPVTTIVPHASETAPPGTQPPTTPPG